MSGFWVILKRICEFETELKAWMGKEFDEFWS